ncbi:MAG: ferritin-like domain-containing protein [Chloroflexi bacterium]|nr:ferritin-like domain-containing protein [Chloroflexota bacterium]
MEIQNETDVVRRDVLKGGLKLGAAAGLAALVLGVNESGGKVFAQSASPFKSDVDVLNYALTLEHFEAELYKALLGLGKLQGKDLQYVQLFGMQEQAHVDAVTAAVQKLGGTPVGKGNYNFGAAGPTDTREQVLNILATVEAVGVSAYEGAAIYIQSPDILAAAGSIMEVEARHTAVVRGLVGLFPVPDAFETSRTPDEVLKIVTPFFKS